MPPLKKDPNEEFVKEIFLQLLDRWDVKDRASSKNLAKHSYLIAEGFLEVAKEKLVPPKPR